MKSRIGWRVTTPDPRQGGDVGAARSTSLQSFAASKPRKGLVHQGLVKNMPHDVFISYSSHDKSVADAVCAKLEADRIRCWIAPRDVLPGIPYAEALIDALNAASVFVLVLSAQSNTSPQVLREVERAVHRGLPIIPFRIEDVALSKAMEFFVSAPHWLDAMTPPLEMHILKLSETVRALLSAGSQSGDASLAKKQRTREFSASDEESLRGLYVCFDRPAFRLGFNHEADLEALMVAIDDTIAAINTGVNRRRDGIVFGQPVKGKAYLESDYLRDSFDKIVMLLTEAKSTYEQAVRSGCFFDLDSYTVFEGVPREGRPSGFRQVLSKLTGRGAKNVPREGRRIAFHYARQDEAITVAVRIDELRNGVLAIANTGYERLGMRPFPFIETPQHYLHYLKRNKDS